RERSRTHLSDLGRRLLPYLEGVLSNAQAAKTMASTMLKLADAPLKIGVMCTIGPLRFVSFLSYFRQKHPGICLSLGEATLERLIEMMDSGELDVAITARADRFEDRFHVQPIYEEPFCIAFAAGHRFEQQNAVRVADVDGESYLSRLN